MEICKCDITQENFRSMLLNTAAPGRVLSKDYNEMQDKTVLLSLDWALTMKVSRPRPPVYTCLSS